MGHVHRQSSPNVARAWAIRLLISAAAFALAVGATGALAHYKTTVLLTTDEVDQAAKKAGGAGYRAPGH